ncbi:MAG: prepilin-type N-terminal cleavage/methylation domain-containing protein [Verrucomicrobia bacterium]|nr:prepilin-type N-terminal cleavage/methylation domain-containing protein [Verrucomicrobiota bacterium]
MLRSNRGLTLVELMLVVFIIGMLGAAAAGSHMRARERSQQVLCLQYRQAIEAAEERYVLGEGLHSPALADLEAKGYLALFETCPAGGSYAWEEQDPDSALYRTALVCSIHGTTDDPQGGGQAAGRQRQNLRQYRPGPNPPRHPDHDSGVSRQR